ncbi:MAG: hypothetical protein HXY23_04275 [Parvularculaceae bacterium]|nr:hypothetical protein [Parvularculaceae bacterium]
MKRTVAAAGAALSVLSSALAGEAYAPMAAFAPLDGRTYRAEWTDESGKKTIDVASYELILGGRALQSTHRIEGSTYGGRSIIFYDEGAKEYVFHYFTTAGFHTTGTAKMEDGVLIASEAVKGHAIVAAVESRSRFDPEKLSVEVVYVGKDGSRSPQPVRAYLPTANRGDLFP